MSNNSDCPHFKYSRTSVTGSFLQHGDENSTISTNPQNNSFVYFEQVDMSLNYGDNMENCRNRLPDEELNKLENDGEKEENNLRIHHCDSQSQSKDYFQMSMISTSLMLSIFAVLKHFEYKQGFSLPMVLSVLLYFLYCWYSPSYFNDYMPRILSYLNGCIWFIWLCIYTAIEKYYFSDGIHIMIVSTIILTIMHAITMIYFIWKAITCAKESQPIAIWIMNAVIGIVAFIMLCLSCFMKFLFLC